METIKIFDLEFEPYIKASEIAQATKRVAAEIDNDYCACESQPIILITLNGAMIWAAQLITNLTTQFEWAFAKCSSYGESTQSSGDVKMQVNPIVELKGRHVLIVEDIVDTGNTWEFLHKYALEQGAKSVKIATMSLKPEAYKKTLPLDYIALELEDKFVIGNGLDFNQYGRNLKDIYKLCE